MESRYDRRHDDIEVRERLVRAETSMEQVVNRLKELGERTHIHSTTLATIVGDLEHLTDKMTEIIDLLDRNRAAAAAEHTALKAELTPLKADFYDRRVAADLIAKRQANMLLRHPVFLTALTALATIAAGWGVWIVQFFLGGPKS